VTMIRNEILTLFVVCVSQLMCISHTRAADHNSLIRRLLETPAVPPYIQTNSSGEVVYVRLSGIEATETNVTTTCNVKSITNLVVICPRDRSLSFANLTNVARLPRLQALRVHYVSRGNFNDLADALADSKTLMAINFAFLPIGASITNLSAVETLVSLNLERCSDVRVEWLMPLLQNGHIRDLTVAGSDPPLSATDLKKLRDLATTRQIRFRYVGAKSQTELR
jgi:hypothetical protein